MPWTHPDQLLPGCSGSILMIVYVKVFIVNLFLEDLFTNSIKR